MSKRDELRTIDLKFLTGRCYGIRFDLSAEPLDLLSLLPFVANQAYGYYNSRRRDSNDRFLRVSITKVIDGSWSSNF